MSKKPSSKSAIALRATEPVEQQIIMRGHRVMLDRDLEILYGVTTKRLNEQVKRNRARFPEDFMFRLTLNEGREVAVSRSQPATLKRGGNLKYGPYAFTEHGAVMLASVLNSKIAIEASLQVVRAFVKLRTVLAAHKDFADRLNTLEEKYDKHDEHLKTVFRSASSIVDSPAQRCAPANRV